MKRLLVLMTAIVTMAITGCGGDSLRYGVVTSISYHPARTWTSIYFIGKTWHTQVHHTPEHWSVLFWGITCDGDTVEQNRDYGSDWAKVGDEIHENCEAK